jgi:hypothetical protein
MAYKRKSWIRGRKCTRKRRVRVRGQGTALRCVAWGPKRSGGSSPRRSSKASNKRRSKARGRKPWNKGKHCIEQGIGPSGKVVCRSYGKVYGGKVKNRRRSTPNYSDVSNRVGTYAERVRNRSMIPGGGYIGYRGDASASDGTPSWMAL